MDKRVCVVKMAGISLLLLPLLSCRGGQLAFDEQDVRVLGAGEVSACEKRGSAHVSLTDRERSTGRAAASAEGQLLSLARNSAVQLGGNVLIPMTDVHDGSQSFTVFLCGR